MNIILPTFIIYNIIQPMMKNNTDAYAIISNKILDMEFMPNQRLNAVDLSAELNVSRTIVREALLRLAAEDMLIQEPNKGFRTHKLSPKGVQDLLEFRLAIEGVAVQLAVRHATHEQAETLLHYAQETLQYAPPKTSIAHMIAYDEKFHMDIATMSGNQELVKQLQRVNQRIRLIRWIGSQRITLPSRKQHVYIAQAIVDRDEKKALRHMKKHISHRIENIQKDLSKHILFPLLQQDKA